MGCTASINKNQIKKSTEIEIINERDLPGDLRGIESIQFRSEGKVLKVHFRLNHKKVTNLVNYSYK